MTVSNQLPRHRSGAKTVTPFTDLTDTLQTAAVGTRGVAIASATGVALTAVVSGAATADPLPTTLPQTGNNDFVSNLTETQSATLVSLDIDWEPGDELAAVVAEPEPEPEPEVETVEAASRDHNRDAGVAQEAAADFVAPPPSSGGVVGTALQYVGSPYVWAGTSPAGFDCSGFVQYVFAQHGINLPRMSDAQGAAGTRIPASEMQPGDLLVWPGRHIAIYIGNGQLVHASRPGVGVVVAPIYDHNYWVSRI